MDYPILLIIILVILGFLGLTIDYLNKTKTLEDKKLLNDIKGETSKYRQTKIGEWLLQIFLSTRPECFYLCAQVEPGEAMPQFMKELIPIVERHDPDTIVTFTYRNSTICIQCQHIIAITIQYTEKSVLSDG